MANKLVHSFCSCKCNDFELFVQSCYFIASCLYARHSGFRISLYTDERFEDVVKFAPYEKIHVVDFKLNNPSDKLLHSTKITALENEPLGTIHIDGDVFLKNKILKSLMNFDDAGCIVRTIDIVDDSNMVSQTINDLSSIAYHPYMSREMSKVCDCSIIGFNNESLKNEWISGYSNMMNNITENGTSFGLFSRPDKVMEGKLIHDICKFLRIKIKQITKGETNLDEEVRKHNLDVIGLERVMVDKKEDITRCLLIIKLLDHYAYQKVVDLWYDKYSEFFNFDPKNIII